MTKKAAILSVLLFPLVCMATVDQLSLTYQPLYGGDEEGPFIKPVYFITGCASPLIQVQAVCASNVIVRSSAMPHQGDCNLASLYGVQTPCQDEKSGGVVAVRLDLTALAKPPGIHLSEEQVIDAVIQCLQLVLGELRYVEMKLTVQCPKEKLKPEWRKREKSYPLRHDEQEQQGQHPAGG